MGVAAQHESRLDPLTVAHQLDLLDAAATVLSCELLGRDSCGLEDPRIEHELSCSSGSRRVVVRYRLRRRLHRGLTRTLSPRAENDALPCGTKTDHGGRRDRQCEHDGQSRLAAFVA